MKLRLLGATALAVAMGTCAPASATIVDVVYTGWIVGGYDEAGLFGAASTNITGDFFTLRYIFDTTKGSTLASPAENYADGGSEYFSNSPALSAVVTIDGHSASIGVPGYYGDIIGVNNGTLIQQYHRADYFNNNEGNVWIYNYVYSTIWTYTSTLPSSIVGPFTYNVQPGDTAYGFLSFYTDDNNTGQIASAYAYLAPSTLTVSSEVTGVPEPSTWAMTLLGFAGLGYAGYRGRRSAVAAAF